MALPQLPDPLLVKAHLEKAIRENKRPQIMLYEFLASDSYAANYIGHVLLDNREAIKTLVSPAGRKWLHTWLDDTLNYLEQIAKG